MTRITATRRRAVTAVSALAVLLGSAAGPAWADTTTSTTTAQPGPSYWQPPANYNNLPPNVGPGGQPDQTYAQGQVGCIISGVGNVALQNEPAAQSMLDIADAQKLAREWTPKPK